MLKVVLPCLVLASVLPVLALSFTPVPVEAGCPCEGDGLPLPSPVTVVVDADVSPSGAGDIEVAGQMPYNYPFVHIVEEGTYIHLEALPVDGYYFVGWSGDLTGNDNPTEARIIEDTKITAHFFPEEILSEDNVLRVVFPTGTVVQDEDGTPLIGLEITINELPLPTPPEADIVGLPYELGPKGTTFDQPVAVNFSYDPAEIPQGIAEEDLAIAYYNDVVVEWLFLPSVVDVASHTVITVVDHLSTFAVIAPIPPPLPAVFTVSALKIYPLEAEIGETVVISVLVTNSGELEDSYSVALELNGIIVETREITLAGGSQMLTFSTARDEAGSYSLDINGLEGSFTVLGTPLLPIVLPNAVIWTILGLVIAAFVVPAIIFIVKMCRRYDDYY